MHVECGNKFRLVCDGPRGIRASLIGTSNRVNGLIEMYIRSRLKSCKSKPVLKKMKCVLNNLFKVLCVSAPVERTRNILGYLRFKRSIWYSKRIRRPSYD